MTVPAATTDPASPFPAPASGVLSVPRGGSFFLALADIKLAHSVFALPFAVLAAFLATPLFRPAPGSGHAVGSPSAISPLPSPSSAFGAQLVLIVLCMVAARTWAMLVNRLADRRFDAANPRTQRRPLASGRLPVRIAVAITGAAGLLFVAAAALFWVFFANSWPVLLAVPVLAWIAFYSFTKRFTALCHVFLGGALAASPVAAAIAVDPAALSTTPAVWWLAGMVLAWVAGFDVIYALQDIDFDRAAGLHSVPARLGWRGGLWVSRGLHGAALAMLILAWRADARFGIAFGAGVAAVAALLALEHLILVRRGRSGLEMAFFTVNGVVSCILGVLGCLDVML